MNYQDNAKRMKARRAAAESGAGATATPKAASTKSETSDETVAVSKPGRLRRFLLWSALVVLVGLTAMVFIEWAPYQQVKNARPEDYFAKQEAGIYLREGSMMEEPKDEKANKDLVRIKSVPPSMHDAEKELTPLLRKGVPAVEDKWFGWHFGINPFRIVISWLRNKVAGKVVEGASTIHQQAARTFYLNRDKTYERKIAEARLAIALWWAKTSNEVLGLYTSLVAMGSRSGQELRGFYEASWAWFNKPPNQLTIGQQAILAGMPKGPSIFNPSAPRCKERRDMVIDIWFKAGLITEAEAKAAKAEPIVAADTVVGGNSYAGDKVMSEEERILAEVNKQQDTNVKPVEVQAYSTIHSEAQARLKAAVASQEKAITAQLGGDNGWQISAVLVNVNTREVLAAVGGRDYAHSQFNRLDSNLPVGSAFKPFVYGKGLEQGSIGLMTRLPDTAGAAFNFPGTSEPYSVSNHDDQYDGEVGARKALAKSKNVPAVALEQKLGLSNALTMAEAAGLPVQQVPSAVLGPVGATTLQVAEAYTALARGGTRVKLHFIRKIVKGKDVLYDYANDKGEVDVMSASTAFLLSSALSDVVEPGKGTAGIVRQMGFKGAIAIKTGSDQYAWCVGYTPDGLLLVVCIGFDVPGDHLKKLKKLFGGTTSARVHGAFWTGLYADHAGYFRKKAFDVPESVEKVQCTLPSGETLDEYAVKGRGCQFEFKTVVSAVATPTASATPTPSPSPSVSPSPAITGGLRMPTQEQIDGMIINTNPDNKPPVASPTLKPIGSPSPAATATPKPSPTAKPSPTPSPKCGEDWRVPCPEKPE